MTKLIVSIAHTQEEFFALIRLREDVFVIEQKVPLELELDNDDYRATHIVAKAEGRVVGTARIIVTGKTGKIGRMAVKKEWRRKKIGEQMMIRLVELARDRGVSDLIVHAQVQAIPFYACHGFKAEGGIFEEAGISHYKMRYTLTDKHH